MPPERHSAAALRFRSNLYQWTGGNHYGGRLALAQDLFLGLIRG
jgi:hypothetical protein